MFKFFTPVLFEELQSCFRETIYTKKILNLEWPEKLKSLVFTSKEIKVTHEMIDKHLVKPR